MAELISMWAAPDSRGRGIGDALITAVARWASEHGARALQLDVVAGNANAIALYARRGFVDLGPSREISKRAMVKVVGSVIGQPGGTGGER